MKRSLLLFAICVSLLAVDREAYTQSAAVVLRPAYTDISDHASRGAVLIRLSAYVSPDARYRLFNGATQYNCWNPVTGSYVTSNSYSSGPPVPGNPAAESFFWIAWLRGSNNSTAATYRDRQGPDYAVNFQSVALPGSESVTTPLTITGKLASSPSYSLEAKYIILAWSGMNLVSASHSDPSTGDFTVVYPAGAVIDKLEARTLADAVCGTKAGQWTESADAGIMALSEVLGIRKSAFNDGKIMPYPVPADDYVKIPGLTGVDEADLYNLAGIRVRSITGEEISSGSINTAGLSSGVYFLRARGVSGVKAYRFVKK